MLVIYPYARVGSTAARRNRGRPGPLRRIKMAEYNLAKLAALKHALARPNTQFPARRAGIGCSRRVSMLQRAKTVDEILKLLIFAPARRDAGNNQPQRFGIRGARGAIADLRRACGLSHIMRRDTRDYSRL